MLWVGWYGFNAGSAVGADVVAANAFTTTTLATAVRLIRLADGGMAPERQTERAGLLLGRRRGTGSNYTGLRIRHCRRGRCSLASQPGIVPFFFCFKVSKAGSGMTMLSTHSGVHAVGGTMGAFLTGGPGTKRCQRESGHQT